MKISSRKPTFREKVSNVLSRIVINSAKPKLPTLQRRIEVLEDEIIELRKQIYYNEAEPPAKGRQLSRIERLEEHCL